jgi:hypothetical protein
MDSRKFYVYVYLDQSKCGKFQYKGLNYCFLYEPFYIGKGSGTRYKNHLTPSSMSRNTYMANKLTKMINENNEPIILKIYENLTEKEALNIEKLFINKIGRRITNEGSLANMTEGGENGTGLKKEHHPNWGKKLSEETKKKISNKLKINNPMFKREVVEKVRQKNIGRDPWNKGSKETRPEVIKKMSDKKKKYYNIVSECKKTGEKKYFNDIKEVMNFLGKTYGMIRIYFKKGESKDYFWTFDKKEE